ncbi:MAG: sugar transferase [Microscillaceae bacterium]|nr:sugar transferase [Microscillaceae bacterium]
MKYIFKSFVYFLIHFIFILFFFLPLLGIGILLFFTNRGQVFFLQKRIGYQNRVFTIFKFKTMRDAWDDQGKPLPDEQRLSKLGYFLRKTSMDELPQMLNIIRGEMNLVGPRPLFEEYLPLYDKRQIRRHEVRPGITGWAQIKGRNALPWAERFELDVWYVENRSLQLDLKIIYLSFTKLFCSIDGDLPSDPFRGESS